MGLMDKIKNLFTEEIEEEIEEEKEIKEEPIKKEVIQVEIPAPKNRRKEIIPEEKEQPKEIEPKIEEKKDEFKFPIFDDEDFKEIEKEREKEKPKEPKSPRIHRKETKEIYKPQKEEKKTFKPTPIISPVYGILDKNYQKEDIKTKNLRPRSYYNPKEATVDEIRNKAYGTLEEELETTLFGKNRLLYDDFKEEKVGENIKEIEENSKPKKEKKEDEEYKNLLGDRPRHSIEEEKDLTDLLQDEMEKEEKPHKISDSELFDMIDSMYQKGDK